MTTIAINKLAAVAIANLKLQGKAYDVLWFLLSAAQFDNQVEIAQGFIAQYLQIHPTAISMYVKQLRENKLIHLLSRQPKFKAKLSLYYFESLELNSISNFTETLTLSTQTANLISKLKLQGNSHRILWYLLGAANTDNIIAMSQQIIAADVITSSHQVSDAIQHLKDNSLITNLQTGAMRFCEVLKIRVLNHLFRGAIADQYRSGRID